MIDAVMTPPNELRRLQIALPACPKALLELQRLLKDPAVHLQACADVIASDMGLAAEVVKTVNSAMFGLLRRVDHIGEALRFLGADQVAAITLQAALRRAFPSTALMMRIWDDAARLGWTMAKAAPQLDLDPWLAHSAGLFAWSGSAVFASREDLFPAGYADMHARHQREPLALAAAEVAAIGMAHHAVGSALCAQWGLSNQVVRYVRARATASDNWTALDLPVRRLLVLGSLIERVGAPDVVDDPTQALLDMTGWPADRLITVLSPLLAEADRLARPTD